MHSLLQSLQDHDIGHLKIVIELWGFDFLPKNALDAAKYLSREMQQPNFVADLADSLSPQARQALIELQQKGGSMPVADFFRKHGPIREMGPGRRDREKPWRTPTSPLEILWYRGLIGMAFVDTPIGAQEIAYIPEELEQNLPSVEEARVDTETHTQIVPEMVVPGTRACVDDATTLLAFLRRYVTASRRPDLTQSEIFLYHPKQRALLLHCLKAMKLVNATSLKTNPEEAGDFLDLDTSKAHRHIIQAWIESTQWNDLAHVPGLSTKGNVWQNNPFESRSQILQALGHIRQGQWWSIRRFSQHIKETLPSFQRPAGDFDSWYLFRTETGEFLQGFEHWDDVEGAYLYTLLTGPLYAFGVIDLGLPSEGVRPSSFRLNAFSPMLLKSSQIQVEARRTEKARISQDGTIQVPRRAERTHRYQVARIADWIKLEENIYSFRISPSSLENARNQGLSPTHIQTILDSVCETIPNHFPRALERWATQGGEVTLQTTFLLQVSSPEILDELQTNRATKKLIRERLGPNTASVYERDKERMYAAALRNGIFIDLD